MRAAGRGPVAEAGLAGLVLQPIRWWLTACWCSPTAGTGCREMKIDLGNLRKWVAT
jgi:hypothetical protein